MLSTRQLLLMRRARDRAIDIAIAPLGTVILLPDPDFRRRVCRCVSHVGLAFVARQVRRTDRAAIVACPIMGVGVHCALQESGIRDQGSKLAQARLTSSSARLLITDT